ncbi:hypothetical protein LQV05_001579 [Cryptococcus neoformans]|nr:hypothetical protein LQV05_001579 [Cryptococcus neoformans]
MPAGAFERMEKRIGVELVKARARTLVLKLFMYSLSHPLTNHVLNRCLSWLDKVSENATRKAPATHSGLFKAVVLSTGGLVSRETADEMRRWRKEMGPMAFEGMMKKISLELVRARARTFAM